MQRDLIMPMFSSILPQKSEQALIASFLQTITVVGRSLNLLVPNHNPSKKQQQLCPRSDRLAVYIFATEIYPTTTPNLILPLNALASPSDMLSLYHYFFLIAPEGFFCTPCGISALITSAGRRIM